MKKNYLAAVLILLNLSTFSQTRFENVIEKINSVTDTKTKDSLVTEFLNYAETKGIPYITDDTAYFLYKGNAATVKIAGDFTGWEPSIILERVKGTDFFYYAKKFEDNARLDYKIVADTNNWILDPLNPHTIPGGFGLNSELAMPGYKQPSEIIFHSDLDHGKIVDDSLYSKLTDTTYQIKIYLPPGYNNENQKRYPAVYFQDGTDYINLGSAINILDNLIDGNKIKPVIAIFVKPNDRNKEYAGVERNNYSSFFANDLVPYIDSIYNTVKKSEDRLVLGDSFGGNISGLISYTYPDVFGKCGLQSPAFWPNGYEVYNIITKDEIRKVNFHCVWGSYESLDSNLISFTDILLRKKYKIKWESFPEGHSWGLWRAHLDDMLEYFFPVHD